MKSPFFTAVACLISLLVSRSVSATVINVDFQAGSNTYSGQGVLGGASDTIWNPVSNTNSNLLFADGSGASAVSVSVTGFVGNAANGSQVNPILNDWLYGLTNPMTISIQGLAANSVFDLAFFNGFYWQDYTILGQPGLLASTRPNTTSSEGAPPFTADKYAILQNVISDANGVITIIDTAVNGGAQTIASSSIAGLQIEQVTTVPEPTSTALLGLGGLALMLRRRR